jgi:hypothetical protein
MKIHAYILASDPNWIEASLLSYYDLVDKVVVCYDKNGLSWYGNQAKTLQSVSRIKQIDVHGKCVYLAGDYAKLGSSLNLLEKDSMQRRDAYNEARVGADWVLQLDSDEVVSDRATFLEALHDASTSGAMQIYYPFRWVYLRSLLGHYIEYGSSKLGSRVTYHGPIAVRGDAMHQEARRVIGPVHLVRIDDGVTSPYLESIMSGDFGRVVSSSNTTYENSICHLSWVRRPSLIVRKLRNFGHAYDRDWNTQILKWLLTYYLPHLMVFLFRYKQGPYQCMTFAELPDLVQRLIRQSDYER